MVHGRRRHCRHDTCPSRGLEDLEKGPALGLFLNPKKCEWSWLNGDNRTACPLKDVDLVPTDQICMLGVPLGSASFSASFISERLFSRVKMAMERLKNLDDSQSAL